MARLKGFYFSLDALTASMILIAVVGMLSTFTPQNSETKEPFQLDYVDAAAVQNTSDWNNSKQSNQKVLNYIYKQYYLGNTSKAEKTCANYFNFSQSYGLYFSNTTQRDKACGEITVTQDSNLATRQVLIPDMKINGSFHEPRKATMVMHN